MFIVEKDGMREILEELFMMALSLKKMKKRLERFMLLLRVGKVSKRVVEIQFLEYKKMEVKGTLWRLIQ